MRRGLIETTENVAAMILSPTLFVTKGGGKERRSDTWPLAASTSARIDRSTVGSIMVDLSAIGTTLFSSFGCMLIGYLVHRSAMLGDDARKGVAE